MAPHDHRPHSPRYHLVYMYIITLNLREFRNLRAVDMALSPGITLLYGPNAAGKTSVLESLFYLATTRSPRTRLDRELVRWEAQPEAGVDPFARLLADVQRAHDRVRLEVIVQRPTSDTPTQPNTTSRKIVRINRKQARALDLIGQLRVVLFTPADLTLIEGPPAERRRYIDITLSQIVPPYVRSLSHYNKLVQQRNSMLRAWRDQRRPLRAVETELAYWDERLSASGGVILAERLRAVAELNTLVAPIFNDIVGEPRPFEIIYQPSFEIPTSETAALPDATTLTHAMLGYLRALRRDELNRGQTLIGPHRDDMLFRAAGINLGIYGSRGQQRSAALALKLAEAAWMEQRSGDTPVLLLDDVLSELDMQRRNHVLQVINRPHQQTLITATDLGYFDSAFLSSAECLRVEAGQVYQ